MEPSFISVEDLAQHSAAILERVEHGELLVVGSSGKERAVLMDPADYRLLRALAACAIGPEFASTSVSASDTAAVQDFLAEKINLGRTAERLNLSRLELQDRFHRLGVPLRLGPATAEEARAEVAAALKHSGSNLPE